MKKTKRLQILAFSLIAIGGLDLLWFLHSFIYDSVYASPLNFAAIVGGYYMLKRSTLAAKLVGTLSGFYLAGILVSTLVAFYLAPIDLFSTYIKNLPTRELLATSVATVLFAVYLTYLSIALRSNGPIMTDLQTTDSMRSSLLSPSSGATIGPFLVIGLGFYFQAVTGGPRGQIAVELAQKNAKYGSKFFVVGIQKVYRSDREFIEGIVFAYDERNIERISVSWQE